ncbi:hypothetical protein WA026_015534 [Henosepilachna vigintioctopunctata]|uniref:WD repeat-containing and planar cell polarity effector protein fritz n=1 Tax=Henosepilachna vigintioctopunctata TaxID=420089 RepID=A0AAW1VEF9_9CUCU
MSTLLSEVHFWTTQEDVKIKETYYGAFKYNSKKEHFESSSKKVYSEKRGLLWHPVNKRQNKLKDKLKELEDTLIQSKIINYRWNENNLHLLLSTGLIVNIKVNEQSGDIASISFNKQLSAKLQVNIICDGIILGQQVICICNDGHVLGYGGSWKDGWLLEGGPRRRIHSHGEWLVVWGRPGSEHPQPWSPLARDHQRANLHLYWLGIRGPELLAYKNTDGEPFIVIISKIFQQTLISVEQKVTQRGAVSVEVSSLELSGNSLKTVAITAVPLQTQVSCCELSSNEAYLLICCIDSTLALLDRNRGSTRTVKASFIPTLCTWQKQGALMAICNEKGQFQYYDVALNCVKNQIISEDEIQSNLLDLTGFFHSQVSVVSLNWESNNMLVALEQGPIICITHIPHSLSFVSLSKKYIDLSEIKKAIGLLLSWPFGEDSFYILQKIVSYLLKRPMTDDVAQQLQDALGCYHASAVPLSAELRNQFGSQVLSLTRRYFHQLVRAGMYETAFLLAVDVVHHDLFMDLHYVAVKIGETEMAAAARAQASALVSRCSSEASNCSNSSCSECSSTNENGEKEKVSNRNITTKTTNISSSETANDNLLSTNFNQPDLPETAYEVPKLNPLRINYVKPPQVPEKFIKSNSPIVPPLPLNFSFPNLLNSNLGIPLMGSPESTNTHRPLVPTTLLKHPHVAINQKHNNFQSKMKGITCPNFDGITKPLISAGNYPMKFEEVNKLTTTLDGMELKRTSLKKTELSNYGEISAATSFSTNDLTNFGEYSHSSILRTNQTSNFGGKVHSNFISKFDNFPCDNKMNPVQNVRMSSFMPTRPVFTPPLPITNNSSHFPTPPLLPSRIDTELPSFCPTSSINTKKPQSKVKFSDTVTAFIVPEVKRPIRPAPPSHVMDPQKELADSLPLCHPNEDYLKDFAPVRQSKEEENRDLPKIKVVHFGVV